MAEPKTKQTEASVAAYLDAIDDAQVRADCIEIAQMMQAATKTEPKMWGEHIVGFDTYHYIYASGRSGYRHRHHACSFRRRTVRPGDESRARGAARWAPGRGWKRHRP